MVVSTADIQLNITKEFGNYSVLSCLSQHCNVYTSSDNLAVDVIFNRGSVN